MSAIKKMGWKLEGKQPAAVCWIRQKHELAVCRLHLSWLSTHLLQECFTSSANSIGPGILARPHPRCLGWLSMMWASRGGALNSFLLFTLQEGTSGLQLESRYETEVREAVRKGKKACVLVKISLGMCSQLCTNRCNRSCYPDSPPRSSTCPSCAWCLHKKSPGSHPDQAPRHS